MELGRWRRSANQQRTDGGNEPNMSHGQIMVAAL